MIKVKSFKDWSKERDELNEFFFKSSPKFNYVGRDCTYVTNPDAALKQFGQKHVDDCKKKYQDLANRQKTKRPVDMNDPQRVADIRSRLGDYERFAPQDQGSQAPMLQAAHKENEGPRLNEWLVLSGIA
jgi:hypothetical protein